jgi:hypothetical protein
MLLPASTVSREKQERKGRLAPPFKQSGVSRSASMIDGANRKKLLQNSELKTERIKIIPAITSEAPKIAQMTTFKPPAMNCCIFPLMSNSPRRLPGFFALAPGGDHLFAMAIAA